MNRKFCYLLVSCTEKEAPTIANVLLQKRLITCAKFIPVQSMYWWQGSIESAAEISILMESAEDLFDEVETVIASLHSYETFVLQLIPVVRVSKKA